MVVEIEEMMQFFKASVSNLLIGIFMQQMAHMKIFQNTSQYKRFRVA